MIKKNSIIFFFFLAKQTLEVVEINYFTISTTSTLFSYKQTYS